MFDDDCDEATLLAACRDGPRLAGSEIGTLANLNWSFGDAASPAPRLKHARLRAVDASCDPRQFRVLRQGLQTETGLTADGRHS